MCHHKGTSWLRHRKSLLVFDPFCKTILLVVSVPNYSLVKSIPEPSHNLSFPCTSAFECPILGLLGLLAPKGPFGGPRFGCPQEFQGAAVGRQQGIARRQKNKEKDARSVARFFCAPLLQILRAKDLRVGHGKNCSQRKEPGRRSSSEMSKESGSRLGFAGANDFVAFCSFAFFTNIVRDCVL